VRSNRGHHTAAFTPDVYGHVTEEMKQASAERMEAYIKKSICKSIKGNLKGIAAENSSKKALCPLRHKAFIVVEVRGVEPLSENNFTQRSPGADGYCGRSPIPLLAGKPSRLPVR